MSCVVGQGLYAVEPPTNEGNNWSIGTGILIFSRQIRSTVITIICGVTVIVRMIHSPTNLSTNQSTNLGLLEKERNTIPPRFEL